MKQTDIDVIAKGFAPVIKSYVAQEIDRATAPLTARVKTLEAERLKFCGIWSNKPYANGSLVTHAGSIWHANRSTKMKPREKTQDGG